MSLIKCPECGSAISNTVETCPKCGYKLSKEEIEKATEDAKTNPVSIDTPVNKEEIKQVVEETKNTGSQGLGVILGLLFSFIGLIIAAVTGGEDTKSGAVIGFIFNILGVGVVLLIMALTGKFAH